MECFETTAGLVNAAHVLRMYSSEVPDLTGNNVLKFWVEMHDHTHYVLEDTKVLKILGDTVIYDFYSRLSQP